MTSSSALPRKLFILAIILPIAALVGYLLAEPDQTESLAIIGIVIGFMVLPWVLKWHHPILVLVWNASVIVFFLPGSPYLWMLFSVISLGLTVLNRFLDPNFRPINVASLTWVMLILGAVVVVTAQMTGGVGIRSLGGGVYGGKKYYEIWFAILGYFALSSRRIEPKHATLLSAGYFASGFTTAFSTLAYVAGPAAWFLYAIFPTDYAMHLVSRDFSNDPFAGSSISRWSGFSVAGLALLPLFYIRYGVKGLLEWSKPWRMAAFILVLGVSLMGGFRSTLALSGLVFLVQFWNEGLHKTRIFPMLIGVSIIGFAVLFPIANKLPLSIQRSLSAIPLLPVNKAARSDAQDSTKWRKDMWKQVDLEIPQHFWLGKGLTASERAYYLANEAVRNGMAQDFEIMILGGEYHSGWRSVMVPFGIWGMLAFVAFLWLGLRVLWRNRNKGTGYLQRTNLFLLSFFIAKIIFYFVAFGAFASELCTFTGLLGLSVSLNGGADAPAPRSNDDSRSLQPST